MAVRALVIDANILIRATLGIRARNIIKTYSSMVALCVPEPAWHDAEKHVALLAAKRHGDPEKLLRVLRLIADLVQVAGRILTSTLRRRPGGGWLDAIRTTGRSWPALLPWIAPYGRRTLISSVVAWRLGPPIGS